AAELRLGRWPAIAAEALLSGARNGCNVATLGVDLAHTVVPRVGKVYATVRSHGQAVHAVERRQPSRPTVATVALFARASERHEHPRRVDPAYALADHFDEIKIAHLVEIDAKRRLRSRCRLRHVHGSYNLDYLTGRHLRRGEPLIALAGGQP